MKNVLNRIAMGVGGVVIVALLLALVAPKAVHAIVSTLVTVANTSSNPVPVQDTKDNYITLSFNPDSQTFNEILPDGTVMSNYVVPSGEKFVITDISWITTCINFFGFTCNKSAGDSVLIALNTQNNPSYLSQASYSGGTPSTAAHSDSFKSGLVVSQLPTPIFLFGSVGNGEGFLSVIFRGYLVP